MIDIRMREVVKLMKKLVLSLYVDNTFGVLSRISGLFSRRGYNIDSLTVATTEDPAYSRMTVVANGDRQILQGAGFDQSRGGREGAAGDYRDF